MSIPLAYSLLVILCLNLVKLSEYYKEKKIVSNFLWYLMVIILVLVMGLRNPGVGVDDMNYLYMYNLTNSIDFFAYYQLKNTEIGYYLLNIFVGKVFNNYQMLIFIVSIIIVFLNTEAIRYRSTEKSLTFSVFVFLCISYLFFIGINRMGIAVSIIVYSYKFLIEKNKKKFIIFVLLAMTFHYSAIIAILLIFENEEKSVWNNISKNFVLILIGFLSVRFLLYPFLGGSKYQGYIDGTGGIGSILTSIPFIIIFSVMFSKVKTDKTILRQSLILYFASISMELLSGIVGFERIVWYFRISLSDLMPASMKLGKELIFKYLLFLVFVSYLIFYCYSSYFLGYRSEYLLQYKFYFR